MEVNLLDSRNQRFQIGIWAIIHLHRQELKQD